MSGLDEAAVDQLTRTAAALIAAAALDRGEGLEALTMRLSVLLCVALAYEPDDLKRARRCAAIEQLTPLQIAQARPYALQLEAEASGGFIQ